MPRAENVGDLITADHKVLSEGCESRYNHTHAKQKLLRKRKRADKSSWSQRGSLKSLKQTIPWNLPKLVKIFPGIIVRQRRTDRRQNGIAERAVRIIKEGTSAVLLQSGLDEKWWANSMECHCYLRNIQDLLSDEKTPYERRFGIPFNGAVIPFGAMVEYHPSSAKRLIETASVRLKSLSRFFPWICVVRGVNLERRHDGRGHW